MSEKKEYLFEIMLDRMETYINIVIMINIYHFLVERLTI